MKIEKLGNPLRGFRWIVDGVDCGESEELTAQIEGERLILKEKVLKLRESGNGGQR